MFFYEACSLNILSAFKIDFLEASPSFSPDVEIILSDNTFDNSLFKNQRLIVNNHTVDYLNKFGVYFRITKSKITIYNHHERTPQELSISLLGIPFGYLLRLNNYFVIHGSAIANGDRAICFFGSTGSGKSSIAANFIDKNNSFLTEDLCIFKNGRIFNLNRWIKISDEVIKLTEIDLEENIYLENDSRKRNLCKISKNFVNETSVKPKIAYFPRDGKNRKITKMNIKEKFENIYVNSYRLSDSSSTNLDHITSVIESIDCYFFERNIKDNISDNIDFLKVHARSLL